MDLRAASVTASSKAAKLQCQHVPILAIATQLLCKADFPCLTFSPSLLSLLSHTSLRHGALFHHLNSTTNKWRCWSTNNVCGVCVSEETCTLDFVGRSRMERFGLFGFDCLWCVVVSLSVTLVHVVVADVWFTCDCPSAGVCVSGPSCFEVSCSLHLIPTAMNVSGVKASGAEDVVIEVSGCTGEMASCNGSYEFDRMHRGKPLFVNVTSKGILHWCLLSQLFP